VNADIVQHANVPRLVLVEVYDTPFRDGAFEHVLCCHTIEHVEDPEALLRELRRVGGQVTLVLPPHIPLPLARTVQRLLGQRIHA